MTAWEAFTNLATIVAFMGVLSLVELVAPLFPRGETSRGRGFTNAGLTLVTFFLNWALTSLTAIAAGMLSLRGQGLLVPLELPMLALVTISIVVLDVSTYFAHRTMHGPWFLWRFHRVHHSDPFLDVTTTFRQHPLEG